MTTPLHHEARPRALALELTKGCNLRCGYCYYGTREAAYDPSTSMSLETAQRAVDRLFDDATHGEIPHLHLFGGEPLLNFPLVSATVEYAASQARRRSTGMTFELTTNGTLLTPSIGEFLNKHGVSVGISFDGPSEIQDVTRPAPSGRGSHAQAEPRIKEFLASRVGTPLLARTHASVVLSRRFPKIREIVTYMESLGFTKVVVSPATDSGPDGFRAEDIPTLVEAFDDAAKDWHARKKAGQSPLYAHFEDLSRRALSGTRKTSPCGGGRDYLGVSADGSVYLCYRFFEDAEFKMGSLKDGISTAVTERLDATTVDHRTDCRSCWARHYCGGNCHHDNLKATGDAATPNPVHCEVFRHTMGLTLEMLADLESRGLGGGVPPSPYMNDPPLPTAAWKPLAASDLHRRPIGDELLVYHPTTHAVVNLNATACAILALCDGSRDVPSLVAELMKTFAAPEELLLKETEILLYDLQRKGVVS